MLRQALGSGLSVVTWRKRIEADALHGGGRIGLTLAIGDAPNAGVRGQDNRVRSIIRFSAGARHMSVRPASLPGATG
jgi:hypothetical protein